MDTPVPPSPAQATTHALIAPVTLEGCWVRLEPLSQEHAAGLAVHACDSEVWRYLPISFQTIEDVRRWIAGARENQSAGGELLFATIDRASGEPIGSTRFMDIRPAHRGVEIGYTWLGRSWWRTAANSEAKYLMLRHAFETLGCIRVCLKTDLLNTRSQRAIERLGAQWEGVLRSHMIVQDGRRRDSVYYSVLDEEWPGIRERMERELYG
jgi:RimJ/RimL family protein N-acetyltransferase